MSIRFTNDPGEAMVVTHAGNFHADDVFSMVFLELFFNNELVVFRSMNGLPEAEKFKSNVIVFDIGYGKFDHHQKDGNGYHPSADVSNKSIPYASFGLLWKEFGKIYCGRVTKTYSDSLVVWNYIEEQLVKGVDAFDNGIFPRSHNNYDYKILTISNIISSLNPVYINGKEENFEDCLNTALFLARTIFNNLLNTILVKLYSGDYQKNYSNKNRFSSEQIFSLALKNRFSAYTNYSYMSNLVDESIEFHPVSKNTPDLLKHPVPTSHVGKLWHTFGKKYCDSIFVDHEFPNYILDFVNANLITGIDAEINGIQSFCATGYSIYNFISISQFIESLNPVEYSLKTFENAKNIAIFFADIIFDRIFKKAIERIQSRTYVEKKILESTQSNHYSRRKYSGSSKHILVFDRHVHWQDWVAHSPMAKNIWFVITPSNQGGYIVRPIPCQYNENGYRKGFPKKWHGLKNIELQKATGVHTATFIHQSNGFMGGARDLKGAILLARKSFNNTECIRKISN